MTIELFFRFAGLYGLPFAMFVAFVWFSRTGTLRWGRECDAMVAEKDKQIALLTEDRDWWKEIGSRALAVTERATATRATRR
jgi:hypothetical protein